MRDLVYYIATSIDGFIADPVGDTSGFPVHPDTVSTLFSRYPETCPIHLREAFGITAEPRRFDTAVMGARTYAPARDAGLAEGAYPHLRQIVVTHDGVSLPPAVEAVRGDVVTRITDLKAEPGRDVWLCGGGDLAGLLIDVIDEIQVKINPVLLGDGIPLVAGAAAWRRFTCVGAELLPGGVILGTYRRTGDA
ncbi:deaminase [Tersicoccus sp. Bi-70]|nr:deaminase [Tersicoccus sp. Bi-70]